MRSSLENHRSQFCAPTYLSDVLLWSKLALWHLHENSAGAHLDGPVGRGGVEKVGLSLDAHKSDLSLVSNGGVAEFVVLGQWKVLLGRRCSAAVGSPEIDTAIRMAAHQTTFWMVKY